MSFRFCPPPLTSRWTAPCVASQPAGGSLARGTALGMNFHSAAAAAAYSLSCV